MGFSVIVFVAPLSILVGMNIDVFIAFLYIKKNMLRLFSSSYFLSGIGKKKKCSYTSIVCLALSQSSIMLFNCFEIISGDFLISKFSQNILKRISPRNKIKKKNRKTNKSI